MSHRIEGGPPAIVIQVDTGSVVRVLGVAVALLAAAHVGVHALSRSGESTDPGLVALKRFFNLGSEANLPTYFSALLFLAVAALLWLIGLQHRRSGSPIAWQWWGLSLLLAFLSADEAAMIHDGLVGAMWTRYFGRGQGVLYYNWYKAYVPALVIVGGLYVPFMRRLPRPLFVRLAVAVAVFLTGAVGIEVIESYMKSYAINGLNLLITVEESAEMAGLVLAIRALLLELQRSSSTFRIQFEARQSS